MLTPFGKCLRMMRLDRGELLKDMASNLKVTPAYLSSVENGKKQPTEDILKRIITNYALSEKEINKIQEARIYTTNAITVNFSDDTDGKLGIMFARRLNNLSSEEKKKIEEILTYKEDGE